MIIGPLQLWTAKLPKVQYQLDTFLTVIYMYTTSILSKSALESYKSLFASIINADFL